jgi:ABC-2 type transport system ATP-binding protein
VPRALRAERVDKLLSWVDLTQAADARLRTYSKGMQQRVGIAQALVHDPDVVFLDEPMSGLDPIGRKEIRDLILRLRSEGKTVFMNTHILTDVETVCDRVAIIVKGRIRFEGALADFTGAGDRETDVLVGGLGVETAERLEEALGAQLRGVGDRVDVRVPEKHLSEALALMIDEGAEVISVTPHRVSLESVFLSAVEEGER